MNPEENKQKPVSLYEEVLPDSIKLDEEAAANGQEKQKRHHQNRYLSSLIVCKGIVPAACQMACISKKTLYSWRYDKENNKKFLVAEEKIRDIDIDNLEDAFRELVQEKNPQIVMFGLKTRGKNRGYSEPKNDITINTFDKIEISFGEPGEEREEKCLDGQIKDITDSDNTDEEATEVLDVPKG